MHLKDNVRRSYEIKFLVFWGDNLDNWINGSLIIRNTNTEWRVDKHGGLQTFVRKRNATISTFKSLKSWWIFTVLRYFEIYCLSHRETFEQMKNKYIAEHYCWPSYHLGSFWKGFRKEGWLEIKYLEPSVRRLDFVNNIHIWNDQSHRLLPLYELSRDTRSRKNKMYDRN